MNMRRRFALVLSCLALEPAWAAPGSLSREDILRAEPAPDAAGYAIAKGTPVDIRERRGGWLRVAGDGREGWVRVLSVRGESAGRRDALGEAKNILVGGEARINPRIVAIAGFRGGEEDDAAAGAAALAALEAHRLASGMADGFAREAGLSRRSPDCAVAASGTKEHRAGAVPGGVALSLMTAWALNRLTAEHEARIGGHLALRLLVALPPVRDTAAQTYVNRVGRWLADQSRDVGQPWLFAVLEDDSARTFALPGGYVFLTRGLYRRLAGEAELAAVLAREIARVESRALLRALRAGPAPATIAGRPRDEAGFLRQLLGEGATILNRPLPADLEFDADRDGVLLVARAGYDAYALAGVLQSWGGWVADVAAGGSVGDAPPPERRLARLDEALGECLAGTRPGLAPKRFFRID